MEKRKQPSLEEHLPLLKEITEVGTDDFFYTRLRGRMDAGSQKPNGAFPFRPSWVIGVLLILLAANCYTLLNQSATVTSSGTETLENLAKNYDQVIYTY